jgi:hypothetical protein
MKSLNKTGLCIILFTAILPFSLIKADSTTSSGSRNSSGIASANQSGNQQSQQGGNQQSRQGSNNSGNWDPNPGWYGDEPDPFHNYYNPFPQQDFNNTPVTPKYNPFPQEDYNNEPQN